MRLFFALWPPPEVAEQLALIARSAAEQFGGKPTRLETIHLTLAFLGDVPEEKLPLLIHTARGSRAAPFGLDLDRLAYWQHNHLLWAGTASPSAALGEFAGHLRKTLAQSGFMPDDGQRVFSPHVSLVRKIPETGSPLELPAIEAIYWRCSGFVLVRSSSSDAGPTYESISAFPLIR